MASGYHLREVDDNRLALIRDHDVELVEVSVDHSVAAQAHDQIHQVIVQSFNIVYLA